jgi:transposase
MVRVGVSQCPTGGWHKRQGTVQHLSIEDKATVIAYKEAGFSANQIASRLGSHEATINRVLAASKTLPNRAVPQRKKGSGRPRKLTEDVLKILKRQITKYSTMTAGQLRETVPELSDMADRTVQHALLKELKMPSRVAALKPLLTQTMKKKRLAFVTSTRTGHQLIGRLSCIQMSRRFAASEPPGPS